MATLRDLAREVREKKIGSPHFVAHMSKAADRYDYLDQAVQAGRLSIEGDGYVFEGRRCSQAEALMLLRGYY